jgi:hypothetical protein
MDSSSQSWGGGALVSSSSQGWGGRGALVGLMLILRQVTSVFIDAMSVPFISLALVTMHTVAMPL